MNDVLLGSHTYSVGAPNSWVLSIRLDAFYLQIYTPVAGYGKWKYMVVLQRDNDVLENA
jgi:hypothetical protein